MEQRTSDLTVNVVKHSGTMIGGQLAKSSATCVHKAEDKKPIVDLRKIKEIFMHASQEFCIPDPPSTKGKGPEVPNRSMELCSDWKASTSFAVC